MVHVAPVVRLSVRLCLIALLFYALSLLPVASAASNSPWANADPSMSYEELLTPTEFSELRSHRMGYKTRDECLRRNVRTQGLGVFFRKYKNTCWYNTSIGMISEDGLYLLRPGTDVAGEITTASHKNMRSHLFATPNPDVYIEVTPISNNSSRWQFHSAENLRFNESSTILGAVQLRYASAPELVLKTETGMDIINGQVSGWWSSNAETILVWHTRNGNLYRVNVGDFSVMSVHVQSSKNSISASAALSPSGRYAAIALANGSQNDLLILDYESCEQASGDFVIVGNNCTITNLRNQLNAEIPSYKFAELPRFYGEHTLGFYHRPYNSKGDYTQYILQANGTTRTTNNYVALGDSYSSGEGAGSYLPGTDNFKEPGRNMCHTSTNSYPFLINRQLELDSFLSVACSGARIVNYTSLLQYTYTPDEFVDSYHPGVQRQRIPIKEGLPHIVTLTLSGNDIGFKDKLIKCILTDTCYSTYESRMEIALEIQKEYPMMVGMYRDMLKNMGQNARLYVLGYPQVVATHEGTSCGANVRLKASERQMTIGLIEYFNAVIRSAANEAGAHYVDIEDSLVGHRLCEAPSAAVAVNGLSFGSDGNPVPVGNASFHPNELGHELIKNTLLERTNNFTTPMPDPTSRTIPNPDDFAFLDAPKDDGTVRVLYNNSQTEVRVTAFGTKHNLVINNPFVRLLPDTTYDIIIKSTPVHIGTVTTDGAGFIDTEITIPDSIESGMHSIHIQGLSQDNQPIDVYEFVYVAAHEDDFDGDGIPNNQETCGGLIQESGTDYDVDGIDDACDPYIGDKPVDADEPDSAEPANIPTPSQTSYYESPSLQQTPQAPAHTQVVVVGDSSTPNSPENPTKQNVLSSGEDGSVATSTGTQNDPPPSNSSRLVLSVLGITLVLLLGYSIFYHAKQKK